MDAIAHHTGEPPSVTPIMRHPGVLRLDDIGEGHLAVTFETAESGGPFVLGRPAMEALVEVLDHVGGDHDLRGLFFLSEHPTTWCAGADVDAMAGPRSATETEEMVRGGQQLFERIRHITVPTIALVHGTCVGGGLELALACQARAATPDPATRLGLPEVRLGIIPAWGGCSRLPRLIGLKEAIPLVTAGKTVTGKKALRLGLVDGLVSRELLVTEGRSLAATIRRGEKLKRPRRGAKAWLLERTPPGRSLLVSMAQRAVRKATRGQYPAPEAALRTMARGLSGQLSDSLDGERAEILALLETDVHENLLRIFRLTRNTARPPIYRIGKNAPLAREVAVIGGGTMGAGIAALLLGKGFGVRIIDPEARALAQAARGARKEVKRRTRRGDLDRAGGQMNLARLTVSTSIDDALGGVDLVIEAAPERMDLKRSILSDVSNRVRPDALIATNTSSFPMGELASSVSHPERFLGLHFFNPPGKMPLLEIVRGPATSEATIARGLRLASALSKTPIVVGDAPGFLVNRLLAPYFLEACRLAEEGVPVSFIDESAWKFGMPMGPFRLMDEVGIDIIVDAGHHASETTESDYQVHPLLENLAKAQKLGRKSGEGFFKYHKGRRKGRKPSPACLRALHASGDVPTDPELGRKAVCDRLMGRMVAEAHRVLGEGLLLSPDDVDIGTIFGIGFPPFRGGLLHWAESTP